MIPAILEKYKAELEKFKLETIRITATPNPSSKKLPLTKSKFLGTPFFPAALEYPRDTLGKPLVMWAQLNFEEIPVLDNFPSKGILQFFLSPLLWHDIREKDMAVIYHENVDQEVITDFSFLNSELYEDCPITVEHSLEFKKETEYGSSEDLRFNPSFDGKSFYDFIETLPTDDEKIVTDFFYKCGHKLGGYAYFTQGDPRDYGPELKKHLLLLQIDTDKEIMFGDVGVCNFFITANDLAKRDFSKTYFYWDCC